LQIIVEGWRFLDRSSCVANQFQLLEMLDRPEGEIFHRDLPYIDPDWQRTTSLFDRPTETLLHSIPSPAPNQSADVTKKLGLKPRPFRTALILFNIIDYINNIWYD